MTEFNNNGVEDRSAFHLLGHPLPALIDLASTSGTTVDLFTLSLRQPILLFLYPSSPPSQTNSLLTTVTSHLSVLLAKEPELIIFGLSTQALNEQKQIKQKLNLKFDLLSDENQQLTKALDIPTTSEEQDGRRYLKRMTLLLRGGQITRVDYPIVKQEETAKRAEDLLKTEQELMDEVEARDAAATAAATQTSI